MDAESIYSFSGARIEVGIMRDGLCFDLVRITSDKGDVIEIQGNAWREILLQIRRADLHNQIDALSREDVNRARISP